MSSQTLCSSNNHWERSLESEPHVFPFLHAGQNFAHSRNKIFPTLFFFTTHFQKIHFAFWKIIVYVETCILELIVLDQVQCWTPEWTARITGEGLFLSYRWLEFLFCIVLPWLNSIIFEEFKVMGFDDPFLGTFWQDCTLPIWVGIPLQYPFWSLFDQFMLIQIFYDHNAFGNFGVLFFVPFFFLLPISFSISAYFLFFLMYIVF